MKRNAWLLSGSKTKKPGIDGKDCNTGTSGSGVTQVAPQGNRAASPHIRFLAIAPMEPPSIAVA
jgi:hypothetical protein